MCECVLTRVGIPRSLPVTTPVLLISLDSLQEVRTTLNCSLILRVPSLITALVLARILNSPNLSLLPTYLDRNLVGLPTVVL